MPETPSEARDENRRRCLIISAGQYFVFKYTVFVLSPSSTGRVVLHLALAVGLVLV